MKNLDLKNLQVHLDLVKWHKSENEGRDMCRYLEYCSFCKWEEEFKCAKAYLRMIEATEKKEKNNQSKIKKNAKK